MTAELYDRAEPMADDVERSVLSTLFDLPDEYVALSRSLVKPSDFRRREHYEVFRAICNLHFSGAGVSWAAVREELSHRLPAISITLSEIVGAPGEVGKSFITHCNIIAEKSRLRRIRRAAFDAVRAINEGSDASDVASKLSLTLSDLTIDRNKESVGIYDVVRQVREAADARAARDQSLGVLTGFSTLDDILQGLQRETFIALAAPTSHGKTSFAANIAINAVEYQPNVRIAFYSLEMSRQLMANRVQARLTGIELSKIRAWNWLNEIERARLLQAEENLRPWNERFFFNDRALSIDDVVADARKLKATHGLDLILVDYLQLLEGSDEYNRERTVNQIAWQLFKLAKDTNAAVLALSQVTATAQHRASGRLSVDDIRESKAIGHHARTILMLSRPYQSHKDENRNLPCYAVLQVEKNSEGQTGDIELHFDGATQFFSEGNCEVNRCRSFRTYSSF